MKKICAMMVTGIIMLLVRMTALAQLSGPAVKDSVIEPYRLEITYYKTTNLLFPYTVKSVDIGSRDILAQKAKGVENVLQVKAAKAGFDETNLTVITADGKFYSYILNYVDTPAVLNINFAAKVKWNPEAFFSAHDITEAEVQADAEIVAFDKKKLRRIKDKSYDMSMRLDGIYINENVMYLRIKLDNESNINYDISQLRFSIRDQKKSRRTAQQEIEINPLYVYNDTAVIAGHSKQVMVFAVPKFTIPDKKTLNIQLAEKNGGRNLELKLRNKSILKAKNVS